MSSTLYKKRSFFENEKFYIYFGNSIVCCGCNKSDKNIDVEKKYNIYISKLSDEEIEAFITYLVVS